MVLEAPLFMQGNTYAARRLRELVGFIFDVEGVVKPETGALKVGPRAAGATMSVDIAAGTCAIRGDDQAGQGMYLCPSTEVVNRPIGAAPGSDSRIDLVYAQLRDATVTGGTASDWIIEVLPGTVAASPVAPAAPTSAIPLAEVLVTSTTTSITGGITDRRPTASNAAYMEKAATKAAFIGATESTTSTAPTDLTTIGPAVTVDVGASGRVLVHLESLIWNSTSGNGSSMWVAVSGATTMAAASPNVITGLSPTTSGGPTASGLMEITGLTPGSNTFTAKYNAAAGTASFSRRRVIVIPL